LCSVPSPRFGEDLVCGARAARPGAWLPGGRCDMPMPWRSGTRAAARWPRGMADATASSSRVPCPTRGGRLFSGRSAIRASSRARSRRATWYCPAPKARVRSMSSRNIRMLSSVRSSAAISVLDDTNVAVPRPVCAVETSANTNVALNVLSAKISVRSRRNQATNRAENQAPVSHATTEPAAHRSWRRLQATAPGQIGGDVRVTFDLLPHPA
jgi:hypothetical protein